jgi:hypothetical protein
VRKTFRAAPRCEFLFAPDPDTGRWTCPVIGRCEIAFAALRVKRLNFLRFFVGTEIAMQRRSGGEPQSPETALNPASPFPDCLMCQLAKARQTNALLKAPRTVPNPEIAKAEAEGKPTSGKRMVLTRNKLGRYVEEYVYWQMPPTVPNPNLDRECWEIRQANPDTCDVHREIVSLQLANAIARRSEDMVKDMVKDAKAIERISAELGKPKVVTMRVAYAASGGVKQGDAYRPELKPYSIPASNAPALSVAEARAKAMASDLQRQMAKRAQDAVEAEEARIERAERIREAMLSAQG